MLLCSLSGDELFSDREKFPLIILLTPPIDSDMIFKKIELQSCPKTFTADLDKARTPAETLATFYSRVKALDLKILSEVKRIDTGRLGIPVYFGVCGDDAQEIIGAKKTMGKGAGPIQAETSACMELTERFSFFSFKVNPDKFLIGDYVDMEEQGYPVLPIEYLLQSVHDEKTSPGQLRKLLAGLPMLWCQATSLTRNENVLVPFSWFDTINEYNGSAAGNTLEESALQGVCEIVERHVCSRVTHEKLAVPKIDIDTVTDPVALDLLRKFAENGIEIHLLDFTLDTGIPTVAAIAIDRATFPESSEIVYTAGTAPDPQKAMIRTLTEVAQLGGDFETSANYLASGLPKPTSMEEIAWLTDSPFSISVDSMANLADHDIKIEVDRTAAALKKIGMDVFMLDITHEGLQLPATYTISPGAHFRERSRLQSAGLFAARLAVDLIQDPEILDARLLELKELLPDAYYVEFYRGRNLYNMGMGQLALPFFEDALKMHPEEEDLPYIYSYLGLCLRDLEHYTEALAVLEKGLEYDEQRADIYNTMGVCCFKLGEFEQAIAKFKRAVELDPSSAMDYANIGVNSQRLGRIDDAKEYLTLALTLDPSLDFARDILESLS